MSAPLSPSRAALRALTIALYRRCLLAARACPRAEHAAQMKSYTRLRFADGRAALPPPSSSPSASSDAHRLLLGGEEELSSMRYYLSKGKGAAGPSSAALGSVEDARAALRLEVEAATESILAVSRRPRQSAPTSSGGVSASDAAPAARALAPPAAPEPASNTNDDAAVPWAFCPACGGSFAATPRARFCGDCGTRRGASSVGGR